MQQRYRLSKNREFQYVYRRGKSVACKDAVLVYVRSGRQKIGFSVSKKTGNAVTRNRIKRRLRECVRAELPLMQNGLYVFVARASAATREYAELQRNVQTLLKRLGCYRDSKRPASSDRA